MENASKALIMAGSVLIALLIIGALVLMFNSLSSYQKTNNESTTTAQTAEFNKQFETYNREDVRGSDLYSLLNKVIDYNRTQSTAGTGNDKGQELAYEPMVVTFTIDNKQLCADTNKNRLFTSSSYTVQGNESQFVRGVEDKIEDLEDKYGQTSLTNLTTNLTKIFVSSAPTPGSDQEQVILKNFNEASRKVKIKSFDEIKDGSTIREDVYTYYEYVQFKRAYFDCTNVEYNEDTGRLTKMDFEFTGKFN